LKSWKIQVRTKKPTHQFSSYAVCVSLASLNAVFMVLLPFCFIHSRTICATLLFLLLSRTYKLTRFVYLIFSRFSKKGHGVVLLRMIVLPTIVIDEHSTCCWQSWGHGLRTICIQRDSQHNRKSDTVKLGLWNLLAIYTSCFPQLSNTKIFKADCNCCNLFSKAKLVIHLEFGSNFNWVFSTLEPYKPV